MEKSFKDSNAPTKKTGNPVKDSQKIQYVESQLLSKGQTQSEYYDEGASPTKKKAVNFPLSQKKKKGNKKRVKVDPPKTEELVKQQSEVKDKDKDKDAKSDRDSKGEKDNSKLSKKSKKALEAEMEALEEETNNRINKLKNSKDSNKKLVFAQFFVVSFLLIMIYTAALLWTYFMIDYNKRIVNLAYTLGALSVQIKMSWLIFSENLARQMTLLVPNTNDSLYALVHQRGYSLGNELTQNIQNFPPGFAEYQDYLKALLLQGVCQNFLKPNRGIGNLLLNQDCTGDSVLMSGLELINIKILEYAQQNLARIGTSTNPWSSSAWVNTLALYNGDFLPAGRVLLLENNM